jgi:hypothetical protein
VSRNESDWQDRRDFGLPQEFERAEYWVRQMIRKERARGRGFVAFVIKPNLAMVVEERFACLRESDASEYLSRVS